MFYLQYLFNVEEKLVVVHHVKCNNKYVLNLTKCEVKMAGYCPSSFFVCVYGWKDSRSINSQKKNEANIQPS